MSFSNIEDIEDHVQMRPNHCRIRKMIWLPQQGIPCKASGLTYQRSADHWSILGHGNYEFECIYVLIPVNMYWAIFRVSNHPDFVGIIPSLLENSESRRNFGRDRKIPILKPRKLVSSNKYGNEILDLDLRSRIELKNLQIKIRYQAFLAEPNPNGFLIHSSSLVAMTITRQTDSTVIIHYRFYRFLVILL